MDRVIQNAGEFRNESGTTAQALKGRYQQTLEEKPLILLGAAFILGLLIGLSIPETRQEHELMGERKDKLLGKAKGAVREKMEKLEHVAFEATKTAAAKAKEEGLVG